MANNFCRFLSNGYSVQLTPSNLVVKPCCWYKGGILLDEKFKSNIEERSKIDTWTSGCDVCKKQEAAGQNSFRQSSFDLVPDYYSNDPVAVDINIDMTCNAACVICGPYISTYWDKQLAAKKKTVYIKSHNNIDSILKQILSVLDFSHVRRIKFFGGEPLLTDTHVKFLRAIPNPDKVDIWYTTNASVLPKKDVIELWTKFKLVYFEASIDAIEKQFNYIRWPLRWNKVSENLITLKNQGPNNLLFRINHTLNPFNIFYYDRFDNWVQENLNSNRLGDRTEINVHPCWGTWALEKTPISLRQEIYTRYSNHIVSAILAQQAEKDHSAIMAFTNTWDSSRKQHWQQIFPDIVKHFV